MEKWGRAGTAFWLAVTWDTVRGATGEWASLLGKKTRAVTIREPGEYMSAFMSDVRYALRQIPRQPLYAGMILLLMTVGIAGNAAVFRVFNGLFLRPLPFDEATRLVDLDETAPEWDLTYVGIAYPDFAEWRRSNRTFESMAVYSTGGANLAADGNA